MRYPMITGHTGNDGTPNNSIESLRKSISLGADAFEVDIRKDGNSVLVLSHNAQSQSDYDKCPRLVDALKIAAQHPQIRINCDLKDNGLPLEVATLAHSLGIGANRLILTGAITPTYLSHHPEIIEMADIYLNAEFILEKFYFQNFSPDEAQIHYYTFHDNPWKHLKEMTPSIEPYIEIISETCLKYGVKGTNIPYICLSDKNIKAFKKFGVSISVWTVNDEAEMARLFSRGVENLTTRHVDVAKSVRNKLLSF